MFNFLEGWSIKIFAGKLLGRLVAPISGLLASLFVKFTPETATNAETVQVVVGFLAGAIVELLRNLLKYILEKKAASK